MKHEIEFNAGFDCIRFECMHGSKDCAPGKGGSHGVHGLEIRFLSMGDEGAVQFVICTGWLPQKSYPSNIGYREVREWGKHMMPMDLGYHSKTARYTGQVPIDSACKYCGGAPCYYDGSGLNANDAMYALVNGGEAALWAFLDSFYAATFNGGKYPVPAEYAMPVRNLNTMVHQTDSPQHAAPQQ